MSILQHVWATSRAGSSPNTTSTTPREGKSCLRVPQLALPIFDAGRNRGNLDLAVVRRDLAVTDYERTIQTAFREAADALVARGTLDEQVEAQRLVREAQADRLNLADQRFRAGVASTLDVLDAQRELFTAEQSLVQTRLQRLTNAVDVYRTLGGGLKVE